MKSMLLPFRFKTWFKVGFIGWLAGAASSGGCNFNLPSGPSSGPSGADIEQNIRTFVSEHMLMLVLLVAFSFALSAAFVYLACRFRFVLFDSVLQQDPQIGRGWRSYAGPAHRYFGFSICLMVASGIALLLIVGLPLWRAFKSGVFQSDNPFPALLAYLIPLVLGGLLFLIVAATVTTLVNDFMVPALALDNMTIGDAWAQLRAMISAEPGAFVVYLLMKVVLSVAGGIAVAIATLVVVLVIAIPSALVVVMFVAIFKDAGPAGTTFGIILVAIGILVAVGAFLVLTFLASAPLTVFLTSYAFYFLGGRYPRLGDQLWPRIPEPIPPPPMSPPPPPLSGAAPVM